MVLTRLQVSILLLATAGFAASGPTKKNIEGELVKLDRDDGDGAGNWALLNRRTGLFEPLGKMGPGHKMPQKDKNGKGLAAGQYVTIGCTVDAAADQCTFVAQQDVAIVKPAYVPVAKQVRERLLILIMDAPACGAAAPMTVSTAETLWFGPNKDARGGYASRAEMCSYGEFVMEPPPASKVMTVTPPCSWPTATCDSWAMANAARTQAQALLGAAAYGAFSHHILVMNFPAACQWAGLATLGGGVEGGGQVWLNGATYSQTFGSFQVPLHESSHNFVLYHGYRFHLEYQDKTSYMGTGTACPASTETSLLGWSSPVEGGNLNSTTLPTGPAASGPFVLPATYLTGLGNYVRVQPDWLPYYNNAQYGFNLYMEVRVRANGDDMMDPVYDHKLIIHEVSSLYNNDPVTYRTADPQSNYLTSMPASSRLVLQNDYYPYSLVLYTGAFTGSSGAFLPVYLCRYAVAESECPSLSKVLSGTNTASSSPPPASSSPPPAASPPPPASSPPPPVSSPPPPASSPPPPVSSPPPPASSSPPPASSPRPPASSLPPPPVSSPPPPASSPPPPASSPPPPASSRPPPVSSPPPTASPSPSPKVKPGKKFQQATGRRSALGNEWQGLDNPIDQRMPSSTTTTSDPSSSSHERSAAASGSGAKPARRLLLLPMPSDQQSISSEAP
ncbi:hypothetical protein CHLRE_16g652200v5 [Chlamydomonas reinhardtii]|uniref:Peptidase M11 gametolysin domain-containing protein n=1 Tax=Chlamydomonas reinhardtii TaxID=3055 RepID=A0A2K3CSW9_CHLRE|nr:uncharacterized protein CHLRE_16g652200v5 [Chlamydomonas reinhardtii]PNW71387.1 hypothetical protein CHLRE_16g652200v5 [Chlamydomonas reinhardtii]